MDIGVGYAGSFGRLFDWSPYDVGRFCHGSSISASGSILHWSPVALGFFLLLEPRFFLGCHRFGLCKIWIELPKVY